MPRHFSAGEVRELWALARVMIQLGPASRMFLALAPADLRKSFEGLSSVVKETH